MVEHGARKETAGTVLHLHPAIIQMCLYISWPVFRFKASIPNLRRAALFLSLCLKADTRNPHFPEREIEVACSKLCGKF